MTPEQHGLTVDSDDPLVVETLAQAEQSYAPYTACFAAVGLVAGDKTYFGRYAENAAFNPSLAAMESALSRWAFTPDPPPIERAVLVATGSMTTQHEAASMVLETLSKAPLEAFTATPVSSTPQP